MRLSEFCIRSPSMYLGIQVGAGWGQAPFGGSVVEPPGGPAMGRITISRSVGPTDAASPICRYAAARPVRYARSRWRHPHDRAEDRDPRPRARARCSTACGERRLAALDHLPDRRRRGARRDDHRRRRQRLHRLRRRRRLPERRPLAPAGRRGGAGAARALLAHRLHGRPVRDLRDARRAAARARAVQRAGEGGVLQRRHRGGRERRQVRARLHRPPRGDRLRRRVPRPHATVARADLEDASVQGGPRPVRARGLPRAVPERLPRPVGGRGARGARAARSRRSSRPRTSPRSSSSPCRARAASSRRRPSSSQGLREICDEHGIVARLRRGADRVRAHRAASSRSSTSASSPT